MTTNAVSHLKGSAREAGLIVCNRCHKVNSGGNSACSRCDGDLTVRIGNSVQQCMALLIAALILFVPANVYPIMQTQTLGVVSESTIVGGVLLFIEDGSYWIAFIIFVASIVIPLAKIGALMILCRATQVESSFSNKELMTLFRWVEFVGKWSMVDIFVVAISVGLLQLNATLSVTPGIASVAFCAVVILTIIAANSFDPRLIWDKRKQ